MLELSKREGMTNLFYQKGDQMRIYDVASKEDAKKIVKKIVKKIAVVFLLRLWGLGISRGSSDGEWVILDRIYKGEVELYPNHQRVLWRLFPSITLTGKGLVKPLSEK